jgi:hypothetical protein
VAIPFCFSDESPAGALAVASTATGTATPSLTCTLGGAKVAAAATPAAGEFAHTILAAAEAIVPITAKVSGDGPVGIMDVHTAVHGMPLGGHAQAHVGALAIFLTYRKRLMGRTGFHWRLAEAKIKALRIQKQLQGRPRRAKIRVQQTCAKKKKVLANPRVPHD